MGTKSILAFLFCLSSTIANAQSGSQLPNGFVQTNKPVICGPAEIVFQGLADPEIDEKPLWVGTAENGSNFAVFINTKTSGFTVIQFGQKIACIIGIGDRSDSFTISTPRGKPM